MRLPNCNDAFRLFLTRLFKSTTTQRRCRHSTNSTDTVSGFHTEASQVFASEGHAEGSYVEARAGFEPATEKSLIAFTCDQTFSFEHTRRTKNGPCRIK